MAEHAVLRTLGFSGRRVGFLILAEGLLVATAGGLAGAAAAALVTRFGAFALSVEGQSLALQTTPGLVLTGVAACAAVGVLAGLAPAWAASRREIAACLRAV